MNPSLTLTAVPNIPAIKPGVNLPSVLLTALNQAAIQLQPGDILVIAQKIVSKAENRLVDLATVTPGQQAREVATRTDKDPRLIELILQESESISRLKKGVIVTTHRLGFTSANAGIDRSNVAQDGTTETVLLLPVDPDGSAAGIRDAIQQETGVTVGVIISDSHGRPFRLGTVGIAIGVAGIPALWDRRGEPDMFGFHLQHTDVGVADEIAAAAGLLMGQAAEGLPLVVVRGLQLPAVAGQARDLNRPPEMDMYR